MNCGHVPSKGTGKEYQIDSRKLAYYEDVVFIYCGIAVECAQRYRKSVSEIDGKSISAQ